MEATFQTYDIMPSAILSDGGVFTVPLWSVTEMALTSTYHLPAISATTIRNVVPVSDDTITLKAVLVGKLRYVWKFALEQMADVSKRGSAIAAYSQGMFSGLVLISAMTIRTDMQVQQLVFTASAAKRDTLDVSITLKHMPLPGSLATLLDAASVVAGSLLDYGLSKEGKLN